MTRISVSYDDEKDYQEILDFAKKNHLSNSSAIRMLSLEAIESRRPTK